MRLTDKEAYDRIKKVVSQDEDFCDVPMELMLAKHSIWEQVLNECNNQSNDSGTSHT